MLKKIAHQELIDDFIDLVGDENAIEYLAKMAGPDSIMSDVAKDYALKRMNELKKKKKNKEK